MSIQAHSYGLNARDQLVKAIGISVLPAIPAAWKPSGELKGLKVRGNMTVNFERGNGHIMVCLKLLRSPGKAYLEKILEMDINHQRAAIHLQMADYFEKNNKAYVR